MKKNQKGFTLIELLVVIAIIGLLSTLSILALNQARARARDTKRVADVKQMQTALEMYYNAEGQYPPSVTVGGAIADTAGNIYLAVVPKPPTPVDGTGCPALQPSYTYTRTGTAGSQAGDASYTINYCLGADVNTIKSKMLQTASPAGMILPAGQVTP